MARKPQPSDLDPATEEQTKQMLYNKDTLWSMAHDAWSKQEATRSLEAHRGLPQTPRTLDERDIDKSYIAAIEDGQGMTSGQAMAYYREHHQKWHRRYFSILNEVG